MNQLKKKKNHLEGMKKIILQDQEIFLKMQKKKDSHQKKNLALKMDHRQKKKEQYLKKALLQVKKKELLQVERKELQQVRKKELQQVRNKKTLFLEKKFYLKEKKKVSSQVIFQKIRMELLQLPDLPEGEEEGAEEEGEDSGPRPKPRPSRPNKPPVQQDGEEEGEEGTTEGEEGTPDAGEEGTPEEAGEEEEGWVPGDIPKGKNGTSTLPDVPEGEEGAEEGSDEVGEEGETVPGEDTEETPDQPEEQEEKCQETVEITATNAADIMCALGQYLSQLAHGGSPSDSPNAKKVCFCLKYEPDNADPSLLQLTQKVSKKQRKEQDGILKALIPNRRI